MQGYWKTLIARKWRKAETRRQKDLEEKKTEKCKSINKRMNMQRKREGEKAREIRDKSPNKTNKE